MNEYFDEFIKNWIKNIELDCFRNISDDEYEFTIHAKNNECLIITLYTDEVNNPDINFISELFSFHYKADLSVIDSITELIKNIIK